MWGLKPSLLCNRHLLGEHVEMHMFIGAIKKHISIKGYIENGLVEVHNIIKRHDILVKEMLKRKMNHQSPIQHIKLVPAGHLNIEKNHIELSNRCSECHKRMLTISE